MQLTIFQEVQIWLGLAINPNLHIIAAPKSKKKERTIREDSPMPKVRVSTTKNLHIPVIHTQRRDENGTLQFETEVVKTTKKKTGPQQLRVGASQNLTSFDCQELRNRKLDLNAAKAIKPMWLNKTVAAVIAKKFNISSRQAQKFTGAFSKALKAERKFQEAENFKKMQGEGLTV